MKEALKCLNIYVTESCKKEAMPRGTSCLATEEAVKKFTGSIQTTKSVRMQTQI